MTPQALVLLSAALIAWILTPLCARLARARGFVDRPDVRKTHRQPTPYLGGLAVMAALAAALLTVFTLHEESEWLLSGVDAKTLAISGGACLLFAVGLRDDVHGMRARHKLFVQVLAASAVCASGACIDTIPIDSHTSIELGMWSWPLTMLWIVGVTNAVNLIDGLDGLATGIAAFACAAIGATVLPQAATPGGALLLLGMSGLLGALLGFLPHNFHPARIFLGDAGSLPIGFLLAASAVAAAGKAATLATVSVPFIAALALGIPIFDTLFAMLRRAVERRGLMSPDRDHIHYQLQRRGLSHRMVVACLWLETAVVSYGAVALLTRDVSNPLRLALFAAFIGLHMAFFHFAGAVHLRGVLRAAKAAFARRAEAGEQQRHLDELELSFRDATTAAEWWDATERSAQRLGLDLARPHAQFSGPAEQPVDVDEIALTATLSTRPANSLDGEAIALQVRATGASLEAAAGRIAVFGRLLDRHGGPAPAPTNVPAKAPIPRPTQGNGLRTATLLPAPSVRARAQRQQAKVPVQSGR